MSEIIRIVDQLNRSFEGPAWHGDAVAEILAGVSAAEAAARPVPAAHSIWEIVLHMTAWQDVVRRRAEGEIVQLSENEDWPDVDVRTDAAWNEALKTLRDVHARLVKAVSRLSDVDLQRSAPDAEYPFYVLLHGVVQHDLYHAGQIALLKKALR